MSELKDFLNGGGSLAPQVDSNTQAIAAKYGYNFIVNGCGEVQQRGADSITGLPHGSISPDCWKIYNNNGTNIYSVNFTRSSGNYPLPSIRNSLKYTITTAKTPLSGETFIVEQNMESGVSSSLIAKEFTISFWVKCNRIGQRVVVLVSPDYNNSYVATFNINIADTWEFKKITITGGLPQNINWGTTLGAALRFPLSAGTGLETTTPNVWINENKLWVAGTVDLAAQANNYLEFTGVKIELGNQATSFVSNYPEELIKCKRRYQVHSVKTVMKSASGAGYLGFTGLLPVEMVKTPTVTYSSSGQANRITTSAEGVLPINVGGISASTTGVSVDALLAAPTSNWGQVDIILDANL